MRCNLYHSIFRKGIDSLRQWSYACTEQRCIIKDILRTSQVKTNGSVSWVYKYHKKMVWYWFGISRFIYIGYYTPFNYVRMNITILFKYSLILSVGKFRKCNVILSVYCKNIFSSLMDNKIEISLLVRQVKLNERIKWVFKIFNNKRSSGKIISFKGPRKICRLFLNMFK